MRLGRTRLEGKYLAIRHFYTERHWSINWMCRQLGVSHAAYYKWLHRAVPVQESENIKLAELIREYDDRFGHILGYRRMTLWINHFNSTHYKVKRVHRIMKSLGIHAVIRRKKKQYEPSTPETVAENKLKRDFHADKPNKKWSTDVTEFKIPGVKKKLYLSAILDLYDRTPVSYVVSTRNNNALVFTYAILVLVTCNIFEDRKFALIMAISYNIMNILTVVYHIATAGTTNEYIVTTEIQILLMMMCGYFNIVVSKTGMIISKEKMALLDQERQHATDLLAQVLSVSAEMTESIGSLNEKMQQLGESVVQTCGAMDEVRQGSNETAQSIQSQLIMTEKIQGRIEEVSQTSTMIGNSVEKTKTAVGKGADNMENLEKQVEQLEQAGGYALQRLNELDEYTKQMQSITELINSVVDQTGLLSLNASIEAARAGEAGRGFAVVASEISTLASQTQEATKNIDALISDFTDKLQDVSEAVRSFADGTKQQYTAAQETVQSFGQIEKDTTQIEQQVSQMASAISSLTEANHSIVESVQNISAITEEVSAHSNETYESSEKNAQIVEETGKIAAFLQDRANALKQ